MLKYIQATEDFTKQVFELVQNTIKTVYPKYYPKEVVDFFRMLHSEENIRQDIQNGNVGILLNDDCLTGTGSRKENHITRIYVLPEFQRRGYGSFIMQSIENEIAFKYDKVYLDASLPASRLYEKFGYKTLKHERHTVENDVVLVYEIMEKELCKSCSGICYNNRFFVPKINTENGEVDSQTTFCYRQKGNMIWADYSGGEIIKGSLLGTVSDDGSLDFNYQHINRNRQIRIGKCHSTPHILDNGKLELHEEWQWLNGDESKGTSIIVEK